MAIRSSLKLTAVLTASVVSWTAPALLTDAAEPAAAASDAELRSAGWWREQAAAFCAATEDEDTRSDAFNKLAYECGHADDLDSAAVAAKKVANPYQAIMALTFVAERYHQRGDEANTAKLLDEARQVAEGNERQLSNFGHSHLVRAFVKLKRAGDAQEYVDLISDRTQRDLAKRAMLAALAENGMLDTQTTALSDVGLSEVAYAYAKAGRVEETLAKVGQLSDNNSRDRAFGELVRALIKRKEWTEAETVAERIASPLAKAQALEAISHAWVEGQSVDAIKARLARVTTRSEKVALYGKLAVKLADEDRVVEAEDAIRASVAAIKTWPRPDIATKFGEFNDDFEIAKEKSTFLATAKSLARQSKKDAAAERVEWAAEPILSLAPETGMGKSMLVLTLVGGQIDMSDLAGARETLDEVETQFRSLPAGQLAAAYAKSGDAAAALEAARMIGPERTGRGNLYGKVAAELIRSGKDDAARDLLADLGNSADDAEAYLAVGSAMIESGKSSELQKWLAEMPDAVVKAYACIGAAEAMRKAEAR